MARFDPQRFPDRFALDAYARHLRTRELHRLALRIRAGIGDAMHGFSHVVAANRGQHSHR